MNPRSVFPALLVFSLCTTLSLANESRSLHEAARLGDVAQVTKLLAGDPALVDARGATEDTPLHYAVMGQRGDVVDLLLSRGADVDAQDSGGRTPLHVAAGTDNEKLIGLLLAAGADVGAMDARGETPLHIAARRFKANSMHALLAAGADAQARNDAGQTPLHVLGSAVRVQDADFEELVGSLAMLLVDHGADASIIADGLPALLPETPGTETGRDTWTDYDDIGPDLLAYETAYPGLCKRYDLGLSFQGRHLWALKISDNVLVEENEPEFKYIATMHGDEIVGTKMCMMLIDYLMANYGSDTQVTGIIDGVELWIVPLMNPDGYDRSPRTRYNAQGIDLNRNFPEWMNGDPNTPDGRATEVQVIMNWSFGHTFTASANLHGGALVVNYPFDNDGLGSVFSPTPDEDMFVYVSEQYSQYNLPMWNGSFYHGITNGAAWYSIDNGMQDWNYRYMGNNELTIELGNTKQPSASQIPTYWNDNRQSMLAYIETCLIGVGGLVTDVDTGEPIAATVTVVGRDHPIYTDPEVGDYHRMLMPGTYSLRFEAAGYDSLVVPDVVVSAGDATELNVQLGPSARVTYPNGGEELSSGIATSVTWVGNPDAQFHVQYSDNYGQSGVIVDGFETGTLGAEYTTGGDAEWYVVGSGAHAGSYCARAGVISHYDTTWMTRTVAGGELSFWYRVSSESGYDWFNFYVDGDRKIHVAGESGWQHYSTTLATGSHELKWEYTKDVNTTSGSDTAWIDELTIVDDQTTWTDIIALTETGATSTPWTPGEASTDCKVRVRAYYGAGSYGEWDESDATFAINSSPYPVGDLDCSGSVNSFDIDPFVLALTDPTGYDAAYPGCDRMLGDINGDGAVNSFDIDSFVSLLVGG